MRKTTLILLLVTMSTILVGQNLNTTMDKNKKETSKTEDQWKQELTTEEYQVLRQCGTEQPFTGKYYDFKEKGSYLCAACGHELFSSSTKYDSGSGWPSFYQPIESGNIDEKRDTNLGMERIEIVCSNCGGHLGHVFNDGPQPTGLRYCVNSISLDFKPSSNSLKELK